VAGRTNPLFKHHLGPTMQDNEEVTDFGKMDDCTLLGRRAELREQLERLPPLSVDHVRLAFIYEASTAEVNERARAAWTRQS
jgi:hypothetical protein